MFPNSCHSEAQCSSLLNNRCSSCGTRRLFRVDIRVLIVAVVNAPLLDGSTEGYVLRAPGSWTALRSATSSASCLDDLCAMPMLRIHALTGTSDTPTADFLRWGARVGTSCTERRLLP